MGSPPVVIVWRALVIEMPCPIGEWFSLARDAIGFAKYCMLLLFVVALLILLIPLLLLPHYFYLTLFLFYCFYFYFCFYN